jgi:hypothetical protein
MVSPRIFQADADATATTEIVRVVEIRFAIFRIVRLVLPSVHQVRNSMNG